MVEIALRYTTTQLSSLTYDGNATNQKTFETVEHMPPVVDTVVKSGRCLNGSRYCHTLYKNKEWNVVIAANELDSTNYAFLESFWGAGYKYIAEYLWSGTQWVWSNYTEVLTEGGPFPVKYQDDNAEMPEVSLKLLAEAPVS